MKFERLLKIYWARFFLFGGRTSSFDQTLLQLFRNAPGLGGYTFSLICLRFEWADWYTTHPRKYHDIPLPQRLEKPFMRSLNRYLAFFTSINHSAKDLMTLNVLRRYLIRSFGGRAYVLRKPSHGQRTRSNAKSAKVNNNILVRHIREYKRHLQLQLKSLQKVTYFRGKKIAPKQPKVIQKKMHHMGLSHPRIQKWF